MPRPLLVLSALAALAVATPALGINPSERKAQVDARIAELHDRIADLQSREDELKDDIADVTVEIRALERRIGHVQNRLDPLERDLELHQRRLDQLNELFRVQTLRLRFLREQYAIALERLERRLVGIYKRAIPGPLEIVLSSASLTEIIDQIEFIKLLAETDRRIAAEVEAAKVAARRARIKTRQTRERVKLIAHAIEARANEIRIVRDRLLASQGELDDARSVKQATLEELTEEEREAVSESEALAKVSAQLASRINAEQGSDRPTAAPPPMASSSGLIWPVSGPVTSNFGWRWGRMHEGIDIGVGYGTPIRASAAGVVIHTGWLGGYGNLVVVDHGGGVSTAYAHQSSIAVGYGQRVSQGQVLGYVGCTGHCFGDHLHFEVRVNGGAVDPLGYL